jgi:hypothetical protein
MSHQMVGVVIHSLLTDEELRDRFAIDPMETLAALGLRGFELTPDELEVFIRTDVRTWSWSGAVLGKRVH